MYMYLFLQRYEERWIFLEQHVYGSIKYFNGYKDMTSSTQQMGDSLNYRFKYRKVLKQ